MNHSETLQKWMGKNYKEPWMRTAECVAWAKKYCEERGYPIKAFWWSAWNWWLFWKPFDETWVSIVKTPFNAPSEWDLIFWSEKRCKNGHVAIANKFCSLWLLRYTDQNWTGKQDKIQARFTTYKNCVGWYHKLWQK